MGGEGGRLGDEDRFAAGPIDLTRSLGGGSDDIGDVPGTCDGDGCASRQHSGPPGTQLGKRDLDGDADGHKGGAPVPSASAHAAGPAPPTQVSGCLGVLQQRADEGDEVQEFLGPNDRPPIWLNEDIMAKYRPEMSKYYFDATKYKTYLEQIGISTQRSKRLRRTRDRG